MILKNFHIDLPIYFEGEESEDNYEYKQIVDTLAFLTHDLEMNWSDLLKKVKKKKNCEKKINLRELNMKEQKE